MCACSRRPPSSRRDAAAAANGRRAASTRSGRRGSGATTRLTKQAVQKGEFEFLWKAKFDNDARQLNSLTQPVLLDRLIGFRGFKALAFIGGSADRVFAIDTDLGRPYWTAVLNYSANTGGPPAPSWDVPGWAHRHADPPHGARAVGVRRRRWRRRTRRSYGQRGRRARQGRGGAEPDAAGPWRGAAAAGPAGRRCRVAAVPFGGVDPVYAIGIDGMLHTLAASNGADQEPPVAFLPPSARPSALIWVDGIVYTSTSNDCGAAPNAVWAHRSHDL